MRDHDITRPDPAGVCVAWGAGITVTVRSGHLHVSDGIGQQRRERRYNRATAGFTRLVVLGHSGYVSLEAFRWLEGVGATLVQLDRDHRVIAVSGKLGLDRPSLRRAQALASERPVGLQIAKGLIAAKLEGQARVAKRLGARLQLPDLTRERIGKPADLLALEARTADAYWRAFQSVKLRFIEKDQDRIPEHWTTFTSRRSLVSRSRKASQASDPANAMLNYLYAMLEVEARIACLAVGLDPGLGVLHTDHPGRDSLALDLNGTGSPAR